MFTKGDVGNKSNLGNAGNVIITGGSNGYFLSTDGTGNLSWDAVPVTEGAVGAGARRLSVSPPA